MLNLDKLNTQFDINNIDINQVIKAITENQKYIVILFVVVTSFLTFGMFKDQHVKEQAIRDQLTQEQGKFPIIKARDASIKDLADFKATIPNEINVFDLINLIQGYAKSFNTTVAYSPSQNTDKGIHNDLTISFQVVSDNFSDMILFIRKIEKSKYPLVVDSWTGQEGAGGAFSYSIEIRAVHLHP